MSIWIHAVCPKSIGRLADLDLREATADADFYMWGEDCGIDEDAAERIEEALRFVRERSRKRDVVHMHYRPDEPTWAIRIERWVGKQATDEAREMRERIAKRRGKAADRVRGVLDETIETVAFELKVSDASSMGWPISWQTAMWLAGRGEGLVVADYDDWWDPASYEIVLGK